MAIASTLGIAVDYNAIPGPQRHHHDATIAGRLRANQIGHAVHGRGHHGAGADFPGGAANISGYPEAAGGQLVTSQQTAMLSPIFPSSTGPRSAPDRVASGLDYREHGQPDVVGLVSSHTGSPGSEGYFSQISSAAYDQIEGWLAQDNGTSAAASAPLAGFDTTTGQPIAPVTTPYTGPVQGVEIQDIEVTTDNLDVAATSPVGSSILEAARTRSRSPAAPTYLMGAPDPIS